MNTLDHLDEMGIPVVCDCWLRLPANPDIACVDSLYRAGAVSNAKRLDATALSNASASAKNLPERGEVHLQNIQCGYIGCNTGNGEKLSISQACCLAQLCLAAA